MHPDLQFDLHRLERAERERARIHRHRLPGRPRPPGRAARALAIRLRAAADRLAPAEPRRA